MICLPIKELVQGKNFLQHKDPTINGSSDSMRAKIYKRDDGKQTNGKELIFEWVLLIRFIRGLSSDGDVESNCNRRIYLHT